MKQLIITAFENSKIVPVYTNSDFEESKNIVQVCYDSGLRVFEFTNRNENALAVFSQLIQEFKNHKDLFIGIGTIFTISEAESFIEKGAHFIVSPVLSLEVLKYCQKNNINYIPGCGTVSEIYTAYSNGCELVKVFPANVLGTEFVKAVKSVIPKVKVMPTGGIEPEESEIKKWQRSGVSCVGIGAKLFDSEALKNKDYAMLTQNLAALLSIIND